MATTQAWYENLGGRAETPIGSSDVLNFHRTMHGYRATRLVDFPDLGTELGVKRVLVKDESDRFGLPAFKALGASWAIARSVWVAAGKSGTPSGFDDLLLAARRVPATTIVAATDGNHGRAAARIASRLGLAARIYVPNGVGLAARDAIRSEGAELIEISADYDDVVRIARESVDGPGDDLLVQDTSWAGYIEVPQWIVDGYGTLFSEIYDQSIDAVDLLVVPTGVGSLLQAAVQHGRGARILAVEPTSAACVGASLSAGERVTVDTSTPTSMAGLNCGTVSEIAWPHLQTGVTGAVGVSDAESRAAAIELGRGGVHAGPCGAASLAGLRQAAHDPTRRAALGLTSLSTVVLLNTEGAAANPDTEVNNG